MTWIEQQEEVRAMSEQMGTNWKANFANPCDDSNQSAIDKKHVVNADDLYRACWDLRAGLGPRGATLWFNAFTLGCLNENVTMVREIISSVTSRIPQPYSRHEELKGLLETRQTAMWLSPILIVVLFAENTQAKTADSKLPMVMTLLLRAGASPDSKDVLGKTAVHLGAGGLEPTKLSLELVDMCIRAAKSSSLYGKDVVLEGLKAAGMNGKHGVAGGYDPDTDRRSVYIPDLRKEVWIKPHNIILSNGKAMEETLNLVDVPDRFGTVPLTGAVMVERVDAAAFLVHKHNADIYKNQDGASAADLSAYQPFVNQNPVLRMIAAVARSQGKKKHDRSKNAGKICANCKKSLAEGGMQCAKCLVTLYCSRECQVQHWKKGGHKQECNEIIESLKGIKLSSRDVDPVLAESNKAFTTEGWFQHSYERPKNAKVGEKFVVAVHCVKSGNSPLLIRNENSTCQFQYKHTGPGYRQMLKAVQKEPTWNGRKTYMKASFDESGDCKVYPATARVKNKYSF